MLSLCVSASAPNCPERMNIKSEMVDWPVHWTEQLKAFVHFSWYHKLHSILPISLLPAPAPSISSPCLFLCLSFPDNSVLELVGGTQPDGNPHIGDQGQRRESEWLQVGDWVGWGRCRHGEAALGVGGQARWEGAHTRVGLLTAPRA